MLLNRFFRLEMVKGTHNHDPWTLNAPFRAARHPGLQNNKTGSIHVWTPVTRVFINEHNYFVLEYFVSCKLWTAG